MTALITQPDEGAIMEQVLMSGDLKALTAAQRVTYYMGVCESLHLNPRTRPFDYITLNGKLTLYAKKDAAEQLRSINHVSIPKPDIQFSDGLCIVSVTAHDERGRTDSDLGVVTIEGLKGEAKANAIMKAITKAKRRVTLSICGLGFLDETEIDSVPDARRVHVTDDGEIIDRQTGEILDDLNARMRPDDEASREREANQRMAAEQRARDAEKTAERRERLAVPPPAETADPMVSSTADPAWGKWLALVAQATAIPDFDVTPWEGVELPLPISQLRQAYGRLSQALAHVASPV